MSQEYCILNLLNIEDKNIKFDENGTVIEAEEFSTEEIKSQ